jgi:hypothetical protein
MLQCPPTVIVLKEATGCLVDWARVVALCTVIFMSDYTHAAELSQLNIRPRFIKAHSSV